MAVHASNNPFSCASAQVDGEALDNLIEETVAEQGNQAYTQKGGYPGTTAGLKQELEDQINSINFEGVTSYDTLADLQAVTPIPADGTTAKVAKNIADETKNGNWYVSGGVWVQFDQTFENIVEETNTSKGVTGKAVVDEIDKSTYLKPDVAFGTNLFNKDNLVFEGSMNYNSAVIGQEPTLRVSTTQLSYKVYVRGLSTLTFKNAQVALFVNKDNIITNRNGGYLNTALEYTVPVSDDDVYLYISILKNEADFMVISSGSTLLDFEPYRFDLNFDGGLFIEDVLDRLPTKGTANIVDNYKGFSFGAFSTSTGLPVASSNRAHIKVPLKDNTFNYFNDVSDYFVLHHVFSVNVNGDVVYSSNTSHYLKSSETIKEAYLVIRKPDDSLINTNELLKAEVSVSADVSIKDYESYSSNKIEQVSEDADLTESKNEINKLKKKNEILKADVSLLESTISPLYNVKINDNNDATVIPLSETTGGKFLMTLHKRPNDGFSTYNSAYLPNAREDFSDVAVKDENGNVLPYKVLHNSDDFDILTDSRIAKQSLIHTDYNNVMFARKDFKIQTSSDGGYVWTEMPIFADLDSNTVVKVTANRTVLVGSHGKIYRSEYPYTSKTMVLDVNVYNANSSILSHACEQHPDGELFYGSYQLEYDSRIFKSTNDGATWEVILEIGTGYQHMHNITIDTSVTPVAIYLGLDMYGGIYKSVDKGVTWEDLKVLHNLPHSTDYGITYADPLGFRTTGGETAIIGGHTMLRTEDDVNFEVVLSSGHGVYFIERLGDKLFAGITSTMTFRSSGIYMSEDNAKTWKQVFATPHIDLEGSSDGYKYLCKSFNPTTGTEQITVGCQDPARDGLRIFQGDTHKYAQLIVDVPDGVSSLTVESGYLLPYKKDVYNDVDIDGGGEILFTASLNEDSNVVEVFENGVLKQVSGDFNFIDGGKSLGSIYPRIIDVSDKKSINIKNLQAFDFKINTDLTAGNFHIGFWLNDMANIDDLTLISKGNNRINIREGVYLKVNGNTYATITPKVFGVGFARLDINVKSNGNIEFFVNGLNRTELIDFGQTTLADFSWLSGELQVLYSNFYINNDADSNCAVQHFKISKGNITAQDALDNFYGKMFDNKQNN